MKQQQQSLPFELIQPPKVRDKILKVLHRSSLATVYLVKASVDGALHVVKVISL